MSRATPHITVPRRSPSRPRRPRAAEFRSRTAGYTVVELLMSVAILAIGVSGLIAMQRVTLAANRHAKNLAVATRIAGAWLDQLQIDAARWNNPSPRAPALRDLPTNTDWLNQVDSANGVWIRPAWVINRGFGPAFDVLGNPVSGTNQQQAVYCTDLRLTWIRADLPATGAVGNGLIRAEVRVFWLRDGGAGGVIPNVPVCDPSVLPAAVDNATTNTGSLFSYHFVYLTTAIRQQTMVP